MNTTKTIGLLTIVALMALPLGACGGSNKSAEEQVKDQTSKLYKLTDEERSLATANAKKYFEQTWPVNGGKTVQGKLINCRPTDSNKNGLVSCTGYIADVNTGNLVEKTVYAGYRPDLVGVSDQDTVAP